MKRKNLLAGACLVVLTVMISFSGNQLNAKAEYAINELPAAGAAVAIGEGESFSDMKDKVVEIVLNNGDEKQQKQVLSAVNAEKEEISEESTNSSVISMNAAFTDPVLFALPVVPEVVEKKEVAETDNIAVLPKNEEAVEMSADAVEEENVCTVTSIPSEVPAEVITSNEESKEIEDFSNLVIADVNDYVNVRAEASTESEVIGKLYDNSVGELLEETEDGWYLIESGKVTGYVKAEYCVTGDAAVEMAKEVGTRIATVTTTTLKVRKEPGTDAPVLGLVPIEEELIVKEEVEGWVLVDIEEGYGYVSTDYVELRTDFVKAESKEEEEARLKKEKEAREAARLAAQKKANTNTNNNTTNVTYTIPEGGSEMGKAVIEYALQFVGNPYVYGGSSLTNGTDCSGFVMSVYENFGVSLPHSSTADRNEGYAVDGLENAQPGDIICYSGHVALYVGDNQIVHASTSKTGIIVSRADYKKILAVRRIF